MCVSVGRVAGELKDVMAATKHIVLLGGGHAHVFVLEAFARTPEPGVQLTLVAKELAAPYSGMLPGFVAGHYTLDQCHIDLVWLSRLAGARLIHGEATGLDRAARRVLINGQPPLTYDLLSIDVGITPQLDGIDGAVEHALAVKPVSLFAPKWQALERRALEADGPRTFAVVGGGAAGVELVLAAAHRLRTCAASGRLNPAAYRFCLVAGRSVLPGHNRRAGLLATRALAGAGIEVIVGDNAASITREAVQFASGRMIAADAVLVSTKAAAPGWFAKTGLSLTADGFIVTRPTLQVVGDGNVFAVGDCASITDRPLAKSGVYAVRQGPVVAENLRRRVRGEPLVPFVPQQKTLALISLGGRCAIAAYGGFAASGGWAWVWKDKIDRKFVDRFNTR